METFLKYLNEFSFGLENMGVKIGPTEIAIVAILLVALLIFNLLQRLSFNIKISGLEETLKSLAKELKTHTDIVEWEKKLSQAIKNLGEQADNIIASMDNEIWARLSTIESLIDAIKAESMEYIDWPDLKARFSQHFSERFDKLKEMQLILTFTELQQLVIDTEQDLEAIISNVTPDSQAALVKALLEKSRLSAKIRRAESISSRFDQEQRQLISYARELCARMERYKPELECVELEPEEEVFNVNDIIPDSEEEDTKIIKK